MDDFIKYSGWAFGVVSLCFGFFQVWRTKRITDRNKEQLRVFLMFADYVSFEHGLIDRIANKLHDDVFHRYLVSLHQAGCDFYKQLVDFYLTFERSVTYNDLKAICSTNLVSSQWEEDCWRSLICLRRENRKKVIPDRFIAKDKARRTQTYDEAVAARTSQTGIGPDSDG